MWGNKPPLPCLPRLEKTRQRRIRPFSAPAQKGPVFRLGLLLNLMPGSSLPVSYTHLPGLFSAIQHKQQNVVETVYLALSNHARLFGFTAEDIMDFWQHKAPQKYSAFELAFELGHRVIAELILNTLNKMAESFGFTDNPRYIAEKNYMEALLKKASPHTVR